MYIFLFREPWKKKKTLQNIKKDHLCIFFIVYKKKTWKKIVRPQEILHCGGIKVSIPVQVTELKASIASCQGQGGGRTFNGRA